MGWPWSELGIAETPDKDAIHAAYAAQRAQIDLSMQISAFARLTEAREKALFLASEMQREAERKEVASAEEPVAEPEVDSAPIALEKSEPAANPPEPEPEPEPEREPEPKPEPEPEPEPEAQPARLIVGRPRDREPWAFHDDTGPPGPTRAGDLPTGVEVDWSGAPTPFIERYQLKKFGFWWLAGIFAALAMCNNDDGHVTKSGSEIRTETISPGDLPREVRAFLAAKAIFGPDMTFQALENANWGFAQGFANQTIAGPDDITQARGFTRRSILAARSAVGRDDLIRIATLQRSWLAAASEGRTEICSRVRQYDGLGALQPEVRETDEFERRLSRSLLDRGFLTNRVPSTSQLKAYPDWAIPSAIEMSDIPSTEFSNALRDETDPQHCQAALSLLDALLSRPQDVPDETFRTF